jgi:hypothetical protein
MELAQHACPLEVFELFGSLSAVALTNKRIQIEILM